MKEFTDGFIKKSELLRALAFHELTKDIDDAIDSVGAEYMDIIESLPVYDIDKRDETEDSKTEKFIKEVKDFIGTCNKLKDRVNSGDKFSAGLIVEICDTFIDLSNDILTQLEG